jgi:heme oxygenase
VLGTRARSTRIANELVDSGIDRAELAAIAARFPAPRWDRPIDALGWLFVVERLELAHRALGTELVHVQARIGSFFERHVVDESDLRRVTHAARQALQALEDWTLATAATSANLDLAQVQFA